MLDWMKPAPSYKSVIPDGSGWYKFYNGKWRKSEAGKGSIYLAEYKLTEFAIKATKALKKGEKMKHSSTWDLLDLAEDYLQLGNHPLMRTNSVILKLMEIDTELLSRMPEGKFVTMLTGPLPIRQRNDGGEWVIVDHWYQPVGFEPYMGEDNEYLTYLAFERNVTENLSKLGEYDEGRL